MAKKDFYEILGVDESASFDTIKKAYRQLAKENHPDAHPGDKRAEERFKEISEAYSVLSDAKKRQQYDQMRKFGFAGARPGGGFYSQGFDFDLSDFFGGSARTRTSKHGSSQRHTFNLDDFFGFGGFGDLFSQLFDREDGYGRRSSHPQRGKDIRVNLEIPFETATLGGKSTFSLDKEEVCSSCKGTGVKDARNPEICAECHGTGMISRAQGAFAVNRPCPKCLGKGRIIKNPCLSCGGSGRVKAKRRYAINIACGTEEGKKLRLAKQGYPGENGATPGDMIITLKVLQHRFFRNNGLDIYCEVPIDKVRAKKGTKVRVKTIYGNTIELKIPPLTESSKIFKLKGMGIRSKQGSGDQYVKINVQ
ncbi:MAG: DnaJ C-terminal domain-containing protein [bacterium]